MLKSIRTSSFNLFTKMHEYIRKKRIHTSTSFENGEYVISVFDLNREDTDKLIKKMKADLRLVPKKKHVA